jgi:hypothetical protein
MNGHSNILLGLGLLVRGGSGIIDDILLKPIVNQTIRTSI